jgi:hypothetical protein|tara:strand:+ start:4003 stop:5019 length:1017 start_codon:yes stop_codon:yes gene_type:complete
MALGKYSRWTSFMLHGVIEGSIRLGHQALPLEIQPTGNVRPREHKEGLINKIKQFKPHFIFCHSIFNEGGESVWGIHEVLKYARTKIGSKVFYHMGDPRQEPRFADKITEWVDMGLFNVKGYTADNSEKIDLLDKFSQIWGIPCYYWPFASWHCNERPKHNDPNPYESVFAGHMSTHPRYLQRTKFLKLCQDSKILKTKIANTTWDTQTHFFNSEVATKSKAIIGYTAKVDKLDMFLDARSFIFGGYGALVFQKKTKGVETIFENKKHLILFEHNDIESLEGLFNHYVNKYPDEAEGIRRNAFEFIQKNHNYMNRVQDVIDIVNGKRDRCRYLLTDFA